MQFHAVVIPKKYDHAFLVPIGDVHLGSTAFGERGRTQLLGYLNWVKATPNARIFLMGDIFDVATRTSPTPPSESSPTEYMAALDLFGPYAKQIIGGIPGNHSLRLKNYCGYDLMEHFCRTINIPYLGLSAVTRFDVGAHSYYGYFHHSTGGGGSLGSALNRAVKLKDIVQGIDFYCIGHNHNLVNGVQTVYRPNAHGTGIEERRVHYIDCGSYLDYPGSYAEQMMLVPGKLGSPRIRFDGTKHDLHVSL
jgi:hypothetical protein